MKTNENRIMKKFQEIIKEDEPTLVVFQHVGSQDSVETKYLLQELRREFDGKARILSVDASYDGNIKERYKLTEYPSWIIYRKGQEVMRESGHKSRADLESMIKRAL